VPEPSATQTLASTNTPTLAPTNTPTLAVPPTPSPTPDWGKYIPTDFNDCCAKDAKYANVKALEEFNKMNTPALQERIKKIKNDPKYQPPSFALQPVYSSWGNKDAPYEYVSFYQMAIYAGGFDVILPDMDWIIGKRNVTVKMHVYIPVENPQTYIITIGRITDDSGEDSVLGARAYHKLVPSPDGKTGWGAQVGKEPTPGQLFQIFLATGMGEVDVLNAPTSSRPYIVARGKSLSSHLGMPGAKSIAEKIIALPDQNARRTEMKKLLESQKIHLLVQARLYE
jgi:hypothetical protein